MRTTRQSIPLYLARITRALLFSSVLVCGVAQPQTEISKDEAQTHLLKKVEPLYPAFARAAGVEGIVHVRVNGRVGTLAGSSGPPSLFKAAEDAVLSYVYQPFEEGDQTVSVQTTVDVIFQLPRHTSLPAPPALTREKFWGREYLALDQFPPGLHAWLISHFSREGCDLGHGTEACALLKSFKNPQAKHGDVVGVFEIPVAKSGVHLYVVSPRLDCGVTGNCPKILVQETGVQAQSVVETFGSGFYAFQRPDSPYPDIFVASHASAREVGVEGYVNAGGEWGEIYCGEIEINEDETERDEVRVCN